MPEGPVEAACGEYNCEGHEASEDNRRHEPHKLCSHSRFKSAKHFASWLGLCPGTKISGGKVLSGATKRTANRLAQALRMAAFSLSRSKSALGAYYRRLSARLDKPKAITATAHKLARLIYTLLTKGEQFVDQGQDYYEERYRQRVVHHLNRRAAALGFSLVPIDPITA